MKKFNYSLKGVLKVKKRMEKACKSQLGAAVKELDGLIAEKNEIVDRYKIYRNKKEEHEYLGVEAPILLLYDAYVRKIERDINRVNKDIKRVETEINKIKSRLLETSRERKMLEGMEAKEYKEYKKEVIKNEQNVLDEVASRLY